MEKRYTEMTPAEKAAYRKKLIEDYGRPVRVETND